MRTVLLFALGLTPLLNACNQTTEADATPVKNESVASKTAAENPIQQINNSLATIKDTKQKIIAKQAEFASKKTEFENLIKAVKQELLQETNAERIHNRLKNISEYDAYLQEISRRLIVMEPVPDKLLSFERSFEAKLKMASLMNETELADLKNQLTQIQDDLGNTMDELVIDESQIQRKSVDEISREIQKEIALKRMQEQQRIAEQEAEKARQEAIAKAKAEDEKQAKLAAEKAELEKQVLLAVAKAEEEKLAKIAAEKAEEQRIRDAEKQRVETEKQNFNNQVEEEFCDGVFIRSNQLTVLSERGASCIERYYKSDTLELNGLTGFSFSTFSFEPGSHIRKYYFNGFSNLSGEDGWILATLGYGFELHLDGLKKISRKAAQYLSNRDRSITLHLNGLNSISAEEGVYLAAIPKLVVSDEIRAELDRIKQGN